MHKIETKFNRVDHDEYNVHGEEFIITVHEISEGSWIVGEIEVKGETVKFNPPIELTCFKEDNKTEFSVCWDFGMRYERDGAGAGSYGIPPTAPWTEKALSDVEYDLYHAFFHISMDPNYTAIHYAIIGCLCMYQRAEKTHYDGTTTPVTHIP